MRGRGRERGPGTITAKEEVSRMAYGPGNDPADYRPVDVTELIDETNPGRGDSGPSYGSPQRLPVRRSALPAVPSDYSSGPPGYPPAPPGYTQPQPPIIINVPKQRRSWLSRFFALVIVAAVIAFSFTIGNFIPGFKDPVQWIERHTIERLWNDTAGKALGHTTTRSFPVGKILVAIEQEKVQEVASANITYTFTDKHSHTILWVIPEWYSATFRAVGHVGSSVNLNPGAAWWAPSTGHFAASVVSKPVGNKPGKVAVAIYLPAPTLPTSVHQVFIDDVSSKPVSTDCSWTCGSIVWHLVGVDFPQSELYQQAPGKLLAYVKSHPAVQKSVVAAAEARARTILMGPISAGVQAGSTIAGQTYEVSSFTVHWLPTGTS